jgi:hypothetical protein
MSLSRFIPVFTAAFPVFYVPALVWNWPLISYLPRSGQFHWLFYGAPPVEPPGPGMYYWGWMLTAAIGAAIVAFIASFVPKHIASRISVGLVPLFPIGGVIAIVYCLRQWWRF